MKEENEIERAAGLLLDHPPFIVLTGAGISVESGLPPFRGPGGIWTRFDPEEYGHISTFENEPERAWILLKELVSGSMSCNPNEGHRVLARLEERGLAGPVVTQNVDGLHRAAGSKDVLDVHGDARSMYCPVCGRRRLLEQISELEMICECGSYNRPDIVFFGESLPKKKIERAFDVAMSGADLLVVGTSGVVMPVAHIPSLVRSAGGRVVEINPDPSPRSEMMADVLIRMKAVEGLTSLEGAIDDGISRGFI